MHHLYLKEKTCKNTIYTLLEPRVSLFGINKGIICKQLKVQAKEQGLLQPCGWQLDLKQFGEKIKHEKNIDIGEVVILVDLKPWDRALSLYELTNIWGYSAADWTPMMWELRAIFTDREAPFATSEAISPDEFLNEKDKWMKNFSCEGAVGPRIFTFNHTSSGTIINGEPIGKWNPPKPTSLNGCLIWPETMEYFKKFL